MLQKKKALYKRHHKLIHGWGDVQKDHKNETVHDERSPKSLGVGDVSKERGTGSSCSDKTTCLEKEGDHSGDQADSWQDTELFERLSTVESDPSNSHKFGTPSSCISSQLSYNMVAKREQDCCRRSSIYADRLSRNSSGHRTMASRQGRSSTASTRSSVTPTSRARSRRKFPSFYTHNNFTANSCLQAHSRYPGTPNCITRPFTFSYFKNYSN